MKPELGVCYYPEHWPRDMWADDVQRMVDTGIRWVRIGEFAWSRLEAEEGVLTWDWLDDAVDVIASAGLKIVMGTPSATPPKWVLNKFPDMLAVDIDGRPRKFGSRRHYCFSHQGYRQESARMAAAMAKRFGNHPAVQAWQIDNEYGCHETTVSYSENARFAFQNWLAQKYQSPENLNRSWGNVFWSMEYDDFDEIDLPNLTVTEANPSHWLDFRRFASSEVVAFNRAQIDAMRPHTKVDFIHNYMGRVLDFDHFDVGEDLQIASWDSYPMGFLENVLEDSDEWKARFSAQGDPDFQAFHHDLYRAVGRGRWWVMEQQPGPVNWAPYNPIPIDGMVKLWGMEAIAHGAEVVSYFRWRQAPFAQEQMHAGLLRPDSQNAPAQIEVQKLAEEIEKIGEISTVSADIAIVFDYESQWAWEIQPQGRGFDYFRLVFEQYKALRQLGLSVDIIPAKGADFGSRKLVLIPGLMAWNAQLRQQINKFEGVVVAGPRTGQRDHNMQIPESLGPDFVDAVVSRVGTLRPNVSIPLEGGGSFIKWFEEVESNYVAKKTETGAAAVIQKGNNFYVCGWLDKEGNTEILTRACFQAGIEIEPLPEGLRKRDVVGGSFYFNYENATIAHKEFEFAPGTYHFQRKNN